MSKAARRLLAVHLLGFSAGVPLALSSTTLQAWFTGEGVDIRLVGAVTIAGLPYAIRILWAPIVDMIRPPLLSQRRGWLLLTQALVALGIASLAFVNPRGSPEFAIALATVLALFAATHEIVVDAHRVESLEPSEYGPGSSAYMIGYRLAMILTGGVALMLADHLSWKSVYLVMSGAMGVGLIGTLLAAEPTAQRESHRSWSASYRKPFAELFSRPKSGRLIGFVLLYKLDTLMALSMLTPFSLSLGFTRTEVGSITQIFGTVATIIGTAVGGWLVSRMSLRRILFAFGIAQAYSIAPLIALAHVGRDYRLLVVSIAVESAFAGMATAAYVAFFMSICNKRYAATQYTLFAALMALTRSLVGIPAGYLVSTLGWNGFFIVSMFAGVPALFMLARRDYLSLSI